MLGPAERAPQRPPLPLASPPLVDLSLGLAVMADDPCEAALPGADPTGPRKYYRARYYDSGIGRFISEDPSFHANLYIYASGNPLLWIDPWGLDVFLRSEGRFHSSVIIPDPASSTGFSEYSYQPMYGGWEQPLMTIGSPAQMLKSSPSSTSGTLPICADAAGDKAALEAAERIRHSPGTYNPITNNCAGVARKIILKANPHPQGPLLGIDDPQLLKTDVQRCIDAGVC